MKVERGCDGVKHKREYAFAVGYIDPYNKGLTLARDNKIRVAQVA